MIDEHLDGSYNVKSKDALPGSPLVTRLLAFLSGIANQLLGTDFLLLDWVLHVVHEGAETLEAGTGLKQAHSFLADTLVQTVFDAVENLSSSAAHLADLTRLFLRAVCTGSPEKVSASKDEQVCLCNWICGIACWLGV